MDAEGKEISRIFGSIPVFLVGGAVRDKLLGREPADYDFVTSLLPDDIEKCIRDAGRKPYLIGKRFGTVGVRIDGKVVEISTFKTTSYRNGKHRPDITLGVNLEDDLKHRDFTINSMAMQGDEIIDPCGGQADLQANVICCWENATIRFKEDPLRIIRAARFQSELLFDIDCYVIKAATELSYKLLNVSRERWVAELDKLLVSPAPTLGLDTLMKVRAMNYILPDIALQLYYDQDSPYHSLSLWEHTKQVILATPPVIELRWAALLHDVGKPFTRKLNKRGYSNYIYHDLVGAEKVGQLGQYLKWSKDRIELVTDLVRGHLDVSSPLYAADQAGKQGLVMPNNG